MNFLEIMDGDIVFPEKLPLLFLYDATLLPGSSLQINVSHGPSMDMVQNYLWNKRPLRNSIIGVVHITDPKYDEITDEALLKNMGVAAVVGQISSSNWPRPSFNLLITGLCRFSLKSLVQHMPYLVGKVSYYKSDDQNVPNDHELVVQLRSQALELLGMLNFPSQSTARLEKLLSSLSSPQLADLVTAMIKGSQTEKLQVLEAVDILERLKTALPLLNRQIEDLKAIQGNKSPKSIIVRRRNNIIGSNPFGAYDEDNEAANIEKALKNAKLPPEAMKVALRELNRFKKLSPQMPDHAVLRTYLETVSELPWNKVTDEKLDIAKARKDMNIDHYGMDKVKTRVLEYLAVRQLKNTLRGPILCFVGPPGVGKTSIGKSIAKTLNRVFHRISLGGVCDQSDIRGHRRTYIGSMPGRIVQGLKRCAVKNPVFLLDEVDKLRPGIHGDPASALLEVLDPEQNCNFTDHYLNMPFDLSQVMFIATANTVAEIPAALLDRMEVISVPGYTCEEKIQIAERHLISKMRLEHGLDENQIQIPTSSLRSVICKYTHEAGVRNMERKIAALCRAVAVNAAEMVSNELDIPIFPIVIDEQAVENILGPPTYLQGELTALDKPGVALGLVWTPNGGEVMPVEGMKLFGSGMITLTGQLGDVLQESAKIALNWVRKNAERYKLNIEPDSDLLENTDVHLHFPEGAIEKDGPSAGVTIVTVLVSLFSGLIVSENLAMTGEVTLRGLVLPVGGIKNKVLAAHSAGIKRVILPKQNEKNLVDVPSEVKNDIDFIFVRHVDEVLTVAFSGELNLAKPLIINSKL